MKNTYYDWDVGLSEGIKRKLKPTVSIIVPSKTNENYQIYGLEKNCNSHIEIKVVTKGTIVEARKRGVKETSGDYVFFLDSDQLVSYDTINKCVETCLSGYDGVTLWEKSLSPKTWVQSIISYDKILFHSAHDDDPVKGAAEPRFFKRDFVERIDWDKLPPVTFELTFINKQMHDMGAKIKFIDSNIYHLEPRTIKELFKKFFRYGYYYFQAYKIDPETVKGHSNPRRVYFTLKAVKRPILYLGLWYLYFVKALAASLGGLKYLCERKR